MIKHISTKGLKSLSSLDFSCKNLNLITGTNSSGKSTFIQSILLAKQNQLPNVGLNGELASFGEFKDAKNFNVAEKEISVSITFSSDDTYNLVIDEDGIKNNDFSLVTKSIISQMENRFNVDYLSCDRIGAEDIYKKNYSVAADIGVNGEYAIYSLDKYKDKPLEEELIADKSSYTLNSQVNYWLDYILGATITTEDVIGTDFVKCFYSTSSGRFIRPKNMGAGFSYLISVIIMCLLSEKKDIVIIENPEIHLHPQAQSKVCEFLYFIAKTGRQLFVETHSDHIFNGVRAGIATGNMDANDISVNFFSLTMDGCTKNTVVEFGKRGRILNYTEGLFDQFDTDLNRMLNI